MATRLQLPFRALSSDNFLARGLAGHVFAISPNVVFKCPTVFENSVPEQAEEMIESAEKIANEQAVYEILMDHRHPNIVHCILCVSEGIFLQRLGPTLEDYLNTTHRSPNPPAAESQQRWIQQLSSALAWLENLGYAHGDLRPANIFLDLTEEKNIRLGDFDATVKVGEELRVASEPFCKLNEDYELPLAGPDTEQFSLGSCIYNIRFGHKPHHDLDASTRIRKLMMNDFPSTSADCIFGKLTTKCWYGSYASIYAVEQDILLALGQCSGFEERSENGEHSEKDPTQHINDMLSHSLLSECEFFLANERSRIKDAR